MSYNCKSTAQNSIHILTIKKHRFKDSPTVLLIVGAKEFRITCHKFLLTYYSTFFDKAFSGSFVEGHTNEIKLPEDRRFKLLCLEC